MLNGCQVCWDLKLPDSVGDGLNGYQGSTTFDRCARRPLNVLNAGGILAERKTSRRFRVRGLPGRSGNLWFRVMPGIWDVLGFAKSVLDLHSACHICSTPAWSP